MIHVQKFGPTFVRTGVYEVGVYVTGDLEARVHWRSFKARSLKDAALKKRQVYLELVAEAAARLQAQAARTAELARQARDWRLPLIEGDR